MTATMEVVVVAVVVAVAEAVVVVEEVEEVVEVEEVEEVVEVVEVEEVVEVVEVEEVVEVVEVEEVEEVVEVVEVGATATVELPIHVPNMYVVVISGIRKWVDLGTVYNVGPITHQSAMQYGGTMAQLSFLRPGPPPIWMFGENIQWSFTTAQVNRLRSPFNRTIGGIPIPELSSEQVEILQHGLAIAFTCPMLTETEIQRLGLHHLHYRVRNRFVQMFLVSSAIFKAIMGSFQSMPIGPAVPTYISLPANHTVRLQVELIADLLHSEDTFRLVFGINSDYWMVTDTAVMLVNHQLQVNHMKEFSKRGIWSLEGIHSSVEAYGMELRHYMACNYFCPLWERCSGRKVYLTPNQKLRVEENGHRYYRRVVEQDYEALYAPDMILNP